MNQQEPLIADAVLTAQEERRASRRAGWFWGTLVVSFLAMQVGIGAAAFVLATGDPSVAVVPDYYQKALDWDKSMEAKRVSDLLGWTADIQIGDALNESGLRYISVRMTDSSGNGLSGLQGQVRLFHHARAMDVENMVMEHLGSGMYRGQCLMNRNGTWDIELTFAGTEASEKFIEVQTLDLDLDTSSGGASR